MKETIKRLLSEHLLVTIVFTMLGCLALGICLQYLIPINMYDVTINSVEVKEEERERTSYSEGRNLAELQKIVLFRKILGEISEDDANKVLSSIQKSLSDLSLKKLKRTYQVIANVLQRDLDIEHYEELEKAIFMEGYINHTLLTCMFTSSLIGEVSEEDYRMLEEMETDIASSYSSEKSMEFIRKVTEVIGKSFDLPDIMEEMPFLPGEMVGI